MTLTANECRFDESMSLACRSLDEEPAAGHAVHARAHVHYETGDHVAGRDWLDGWMAGPGQTTDNLAHFSWHAALHELSLGDLTSVRARYARELAPPTVVGCRALVDSCSLLWRWGSPLRLRVRPGSLSSLGWGPYCCLGACGGSVTRASSCGPKNVHGSPSSSGRTPRPPWNVRPRNAAPKQSEHGSTLS